MYAIYFTFMGKSGRQSGFLIWEVVVWINNQSELDLKHWSSVRMKKTELINEWDVIIDRDGIQAVRGFLPPASGDPDISTARAPPVSVFPVFMFAFGP